MHLLNSGKMRCILLSSVDQMMPTGVGGTGGYNQIFLKIGKWKYGMFGFIGKNAIGDLSSSEKSA